jgi:hypothetical protein
MTERKGPDKTKPTPPDEDVIEKVDLPSSMNDIVTAGSKRGTLLCSA